MLTSKVAFGIAAGLVVGVAAGAAAAPCTDGVDCLCDTIGQSQGGVVFCEDFENPGYEDPGTLSGGHPWIQAYSGVAGDVGNCEGNRVCPNGLQAGFDIANGSGCNDPSDSGSDCVFDGNKTLNHRLTPGYQGGAIGTKRFTDPPLHTMGVTYAVRWSPNYREPDGSQGGCEVGTDSPRVGHKTNFIFKSGGRHHNVFGQSTGSSSYQAIGSGPNGGVCPGWPEGSSTDYSHPFTTIYANENCGSFPMDNCNLRNAQRNRGWVCQDDFNYQFFPDESDYEWGRTHGPGQWVCMQLHWEGYGTTSSRHRFWIDGKLVIDVSNLDSSIANGVNKEGFDLLQLDHYFNGCYNGPTPASRGEDNIVITSASEPVPCSAIGFDDDGSAPLPGPQPLSLSYLTASPSSGDAPMDATLDASAFGGTAPYTFEFDCVDGTGFDSFEQASGPVSHVCSYAAGSYVARVKVTDQALDSVEGTVNVVASVPGQPVAFSDTFSGGLGSWNVEFGDYTTAGAELDPGTEPAASGDRILYTTATGTLDQYGLVQFTQLADPASGQGLCTGLFFRVNGTNGQRYAVNYCDFGSPHIKWTWDGGFGNTTNIQSADHPALGNGSWLGAEVTGTGANTVVQVWVFGSDPGARDTWGAPDLLFENDPGVAVDTGKQVGIDLYRTNPNDVVRFDNFRAGDAAAGSVEPPVEPPAEPLGQPGKPAPVL